MGSDLNLSIGDGSSDTFKETLVQQPVDLEGSISITKRISRAAVAQQKKVEEALDI